MLRKLLTLATLFALGSLPSYAYQRGDLLAKTPTLKFFFLDKEKHYAHSWVRIVAIDSAPGVAGNTAPALKIVQTYQVTCGDGVNTGFHYGFMGEIGFFYPQNVEAWRTAEGEGYFQDTNQANQSWIPYVLQKAACSVGV